MRESRAKTWRRFYLDLLWPSRLSNICNLRPMSKISLHHQTSRYIRRSNVLDTNPESLPRSTFDIQLKRGEFRHSSDKNNQWGQLHLVIIDIVHGDLLIFSSFDLSVVWSILGFWNSLFLGPALYGPESIGRLPVFLSSIQCCTALIESKFPSHMLSNNVIILIYFSGYADYSSGSISSSRGSFLLFSADICNAFCGSASS